jgi:valyl-tRNA synthetase
MDANDTQKLADRYAPGDVEARVYQWWEKNGFFHAEDRSTLRPFSILLPPPNVTGSLHMGHALDHTLQDVLVRWKRMQSFNVLWLPGTDHAGIATQSVVERELKKEKLSRHALGRDEFLGRVWKWKAEYGDRIVHQMKRLGDSCDWRRHTFTLDEGVSRAVRRVFVDLYRKGLLYRGQRLINWSPKLESAISDLEVEHREVKGALWHIRYRLEDGSGELIVATTRPETLLGDTAVVVHPGDERYQRFIGKAVVLPLVGRSIRILADESIDPTFGSGVVKVTPAHDFNDYKIGQRFGLESINILNPNGTLNEAVPAAYRGLSVSEARQRVVADLEAQELLVKTEEHSHSVGHCSRSGCVVEPLLSEQWFVKMQELALPAKRVVESGTVRFEPEMWTKTYLHWMNNIEDWCVSRQLWWGHRIPAWHCDDCTQITVAEADVTACAHCGSSRIRQDEDVLDTWFSSALWPFSTLGWPAETEAQKTFYPTSVLVTGHDIIFFWVARMMMMGLAFKEDVPFRTIYIHGLIRDAEGKKMSKSTGNALDPVEIIDEYGADALRLTLLASVQAGRDIKFSMDRLEGYRNFTNKLWNATRFVLGHLNDFALRADDVSRVPNRADLSLVDRWIVHKLGVCMKTVDEALTNYRFSEATLALYDFVWHDFCDWYLEFSKPVLYGPPSAEKQASQMILAQVLNRIVRLLHPFAPFITEEIYQKLPIRSEALICAAFPQARLDRDWLGIGDERAADEMDFVKEVVSAVRNIRGENRIKPGVKISCRLAVTEPETQKILSHNRAYITSLGGIDHLEIGDAGSLAKCALTPIQLHGWTVDVIVPLAGLVDIDEEVRRIQKNIEKINKDAAALEARLKNDNFLKNAPPEVVEEGRRQAESLRQRIVTMNASLARLSG